MTVYVAGEHDEPIGMRQVKGREEPVEVFRVVLATSAGAED